MGSVLKIGIATDNYCPSRNKTGMDAKKKRITAMLVASGRGDRRAFRILYDETARFVFGAVVAILRDRHLAEDVAQEVYVMIWQRAARFEPERGHGLAWIAAIARNRAIDRLRMERARGFVTFEADVPDLIDETDASGQVVDRMTTKRLLANLKPEYRQALILAYYQGLSHSEIAEALNVPIGTAKSWVRRGLTVLRGLIG